MTTTTQTANTPVNVYDAVLGECDDLLKASLEAQRLGRLKMASAYQLLLHTRLIGLGKRFDRAQTLAPTPTRKRRGDDDDEDDDGDDEDGKATQGPNSVLKYDNPSPSVASMPPQVAPPAQAGTPANSIASADPSTPKALPKVLEQLSSVLPSNLEMDATMMEHLARAAVELHHQRTGRKKSADGLLASPMTGGLIGTPETTGGGSQPTTKLAWTPQEQGVVELALEQKKAASAISKLLKNKTEAQVKAFLKNRKAKDSIKSAFHEDDDDIPSKKRGGRGRKPPTTAMNTVPNANLDAKELLKKMASNPYRP